MREAKSAAALLKGSQQVCKAAAAPHGQLIHLQHRPCTLSRVSLFAYHQTSADSFSGALHGMLYKSCQMSVLGLGARPSCNKQSREMVKQCTVSAPDVRSKLAPATVAVTSCVMPCLSAGLPLSRDMFSVRVYLHTTLCVSKHLIVGVTALQLQA